MIPEVAGSNPVTHPIKGVNQKRKQMGIKVIVRSPDQLGRTIKIFKKNCAASGVIRDYRAKSFYEKPTMARNLAKKQRAKNIRKFQRERLTQS